MSDTLEKIGGSLIQHGPSNNRIYLMKLSASDLPHLPEQLDALAKKNGYTKIFAKIPKQHEEEFLQRNYEREGLIPLFYSGQYDAAFLGKFIDPDRRTQADAAKLDSIIDTAHKLSDTGNTELPQQYKLRPACPDDLQELAELYGKVFASYPFPIDDADYIADTMANNVKYFVAECEGKLAAASSGEMDPKNKNAEMTDFATLPEHRGNSLAAHLLRFMEPYMREEGLCTLYTIARAASAGMNITFARCAYKYGGQLINNTQIAGNIETMNLWYKNLSA